jgi:hypothetical protein
MSSIPSGLFDPLMNACDASLTRVLESDSKERPTAHELLAADAFVTWAFEAAANDPATISARADAAMRAISARAVPYLEPDPA